MLHTLQHDADRKHSLLPPSTLTTATRISQTTPQVCPQETTPAGLAGLTALGLLDSLEHLALYDAELPADSLAQHLSAASRLSSLQFGLSTVAPELSTLRKLPKLQVCVCVCCVCEKEGKVSMGRGGVDMTWVCTCVSRVTGGTEG